MKGKFQQKKALSQYVQAFALCVQLDQEKQIGYRAHHHHHHHHHHYPDSSRNNHSTCICANIVDHNRESPYLKRHLEEEKKKQEEGPSEYHQPSALPAVSQAFFSLLSVNYSFFKKKLKSIISVSM